MNPSQSFNSSSSASVPSFGYGSGILSPKLAQTDCPQVFAARDFLDTQIIQAKELFQNLAKRLGPVLVSTPSDAGCSVVPNVPATSDLAVAIYAQGREVSELKDWINAVTSRLDI